MASLFYRQEKETRSRRRDLGSVASTRGLEVSQQHCPTGLTIRVASRPFTGGSISIVPSAKRLSILVDMKTGKIGFPFFGLFQFFSEELKDTHNVELIDGTVFVTEKLKLYGEGGRVFAKDLPFFRVAINSIPYLRNIGNVEGFCKALLREINTNHSRAVYLAGDMPESYDNRLVKDYSMSLSKKLVTVTLAA